MIKICIFDELNPLQSEYLCMYVSDVEMKEEKKSAVPWQKINVMGNDFKY